MRSKARPRAGPFFIGGCTVFDGVSFEDLLRWDTAWLQRRCDLLEFLLLEKARVLAQECFEGSAEREREPPSEPFWLNGPS